MHTQDSLLQCGPLNLAVCVIANGVSQLPMCMLLQQINSPLQHRKPYVPFRKLVAYTLGVSPCCQKSDLHASAGIRQLPGCCHP